MIFKIIMVFYRTSLNLVTIAWRGRSRRRNRRESRRRSSGARKCPESGLS